MLAAVNAILVSALSFVSVEVTSGSAPKPDLLRGCTPTPYTRARNDVDLRDGSLPVRNVCHYVVCCNSVHCFMCPWV